MERTPLRSALHRSSIDRRAVEEAAAWFVEFRVDDIDTPAREAFTRWLRRSPEHIRAYLEVAEAYALLPHLTGDFSGDHLLSQLRQQTNVVPFSGSPGREPRAASSQDSTRTERQRRHWAVRTACAVLACCSVAFGIWAQRADSSTYATRSGERRSITLADGSVIDLNADSRVRVRFTQRDRNVDLLEGQAFFVVAKDKARPFLVGTDQMRVRAVGTQFDVRRRDGHTTVTVLEGRVAVLPARSLGDTTAAEDSRADSPRLAWRPGDEPSSVLLEAGEQVVVDAQRPPQLSRVDAAAATAWIQRRLVFDSLQLIQVVKEFNRHNRRQIVIDSSQLEEMLISGVYSSSDPASLIRFLRTQPGVTVTETDLQIRISQR